MRERRDIERRVLGCLASAFPYVDAYEKAWAALTSAKPPDPPDFQQRARMASRASRLDGKLSPPRATH
jgi:hypothetical protein